MNQSHNPQEVTLELLVRYGNPHAVQTFTQQHEIAAEKKEEKIVETRIYAAIKEMWEEAEGGIDSERFRPFFLHPRCTAYLTKTINIPLLEEIVEVLKAGTNAYMEEYAQITAIDILDVPAIENALRRNSENTSLRKHIEELVQSGYSLVFCPCNINADAVNHYFPIVNRWKDFIEPEKIAEQVIENLAEKIENLMKHDYSRKFFYAALDKLPQLTDASTTARLAYNHIRKKSPEAYEQLVADKKIVQYEEQTPLSTTDQDVKEAVEKYEKEKFCLDDKVHKLSEALKGKGRVYLADKIGEWFEKRQICHLTKLVSYKGEALYDVQRAQENIVSQIRKAYEQCDLVVLERGLSLPAKLINKKDPTIASFVEAYNLANSSFSDNSEEQAELFA